MASNPTHADDPRWPYTYAADLVRSVGPVDSGGVVLSRSDASTIRQTIAKAIGIEDAELARFCADYYLRHREEIDKTSSDKLIRAIRNTHTS